MSHFNQHWRKLTALARQVPVDRDEMIPPGFATRVAARALLAPSAGSWFMLERLAFRGFIAAACCGIAAMAYGLAHLGSDQVDFFATGTTETVVELLDLS